MATDIHRQRQTDTTMVTWKTWTRQPQQDRFWICRGPYSRASVITANGSTHQIGLVCASKLLNYKSDSCRSSPAAPPGGGKKKHLLRRRGQSPGDIWWGLDFIKDLKQKKATWKQGQMTQPCRQIGVLTNTAEYLSLIKCHQEGTHVQPWCGPPPDTIQSGTTRRDRVWGMLTPGSIFG